MNALRNMLGKIFSCKSRSAIAVNTQNEDSITDMREKEASIYGQENIDFQRLYESWVSKESWLLKSQAIPLLLGTDPQINTADEVYEKEFDDLWRHAQTCVKKGLLKINGSIEEETDKWEASPGVIYQWAAVSRIELPEVLARLMEFVLSVMKTEFKEAPTVAVSERNDSNIEQQNDLISERERILGAAVAVLAHHYDECRNKNGRVKVEKIMDMINSKSATLFEREDLDISPVTVKDIIDNWLNKLQ